jgi:hypothetical protein
MFPPPCIDHTFVGLERRKTSHCQTGPCPFPVSIAMLAGTFPIWKSTPCLALRQPCLFHVENIICSRSFILKPCLFIETLGECNLVSGSIPIANISLMHCNLLTLVISHVEFDCNQRRSHPCGNLDIRCEHHAHRSTSLKLLLKYGLSSGPDRWWKRSRSVL